MCKRRHNHWCTVAVYLFALDSGPNPNVYLNLIVIFRFSTPERHCVHRNVFPSTESQIHFSYFTHSIHLTETIWISKSLKLNNTDYEVPEARLSFVSWHVTGTQIYVCWILKLILSSNLDFSCLEICWKSNLELTWSLVHDEVTFAFWFSCNEHICPLMSKYSWGERFYLRAT